MRRGEWRKHAGGDGIRVAGGARADRAGNAPRPAQPARGCRDSETTVARRLSLKRPGAETAWQDGASAMADRIVIKGAREHNLKNIDLEIPRDRLVLITGLS